MINALITRMNKPRVITVTGRVNIISMGLSKAFSNPNTNATTIAVVKPSTWTPGIKYAPITTANAVIRTLMMNFISLLLIHLNQFFNNIQKINSIQAYIF
jgi:hypothetical protein